MTKRVQLVRHDNAGAQQFLGKEGEVTVNTGNKSAHVHDGINQGGKELARADLVNVAVAASTNAGKMSAQQAAELAQALLDIVANTNEIALKANKVTSATANNVAKLDGDGDLVDAGFEISNTIGEVTFDLTELNGKSFASSDDVIDNFPAGTKMLFPQTAAPTGWTKQTTHNDKGLRVVSGTASSGGTDSFTTTFSAAKATDNHALTIAEMPSHDHGSSTGTTGSHRHTLQYEFGGSGSETNVSTGNNGNGDTDYTGYAGNHSHTIPAQGGGGGHSHDIAMDLQYVDTIIASKD